jgi:hypothetical protein
MQDREKTFGNESSSANSQGVVSAPRLQMHIVKDGGYVVVASRSPDPKLGVCLDNRI